MASAAGDKRPLCGCLRRDCDRLCAVVTAAGDCRCRAGVVSGYPLLVTALPSTDAEPISIFGTVTTILLQHHNLTSPIVEFPLLGRLSLVLVGYVWGRLLQAGKTSISPRLLWLAIVGLIVWFILRVLHGYGNFLPYEPEWPWIYFFIESKQPPSLTFLLFNFSWAVVLLVGLKQIEAHLRHTMIGWGLQVLGQTALFFYAVHLLLYSLVISPMFPDTFLAHAGLLRGYIEFALGILILLPVCAIYRQLRQRYRILGYL